jgi:hypothetical protein
MTQFTRIFQFALFALSALSLAGCGSGGGMTAVGISPTLNALYVPGQTIVVDGGQSLALTATVVNDVRAAGATFSVTGPGTLTQTSVVSTTASENYSLTYQAPATVTAGTTATLTITSVAYPSQTASFTVTLNPALAITTTTLPSVTAGSAYSATLAGTGGTTPYHWAISAGQLPTGITLAASTGILSGTPTSAGTFNFTVALTDSSTVTATVTQAYTLNVSPTVLTSTLPNAVAGSPYSQQLTYSGGTSGVFAVASGALPAGLTLSSSGAITGTPALATAGTTSNFTVTVTIGSAVSKAVALSIAIDALPAVTTLSLPSGNIGIVYTQQLTYSGGSGAAPSWAITAGSLPASSGLTLNAATGVLSGVPTTAATYSFSVAVTVGTQTSASQPLTLVINSLIITSGSAASGEVGLPFSFQLTAAGGTGPYTWSLAGGSSALPSGLTLNPTTGQIAGSLAGNAGSPYTGIVVEATDQLGATATQAMTFTINPARPAANNALLNGQYAFLLNGFDGTGHPLAMAGTFTADGNGNIVAGLLDVNGTGLSAASLSNTLAATTYAVGPDGRGKVVLSYGGTTLNFTLALNAVSNGVAGGGYMTEFDSSGQSLTGTLALASPAAFSTASISGGFAFGLDGFAPSSSATALNRRAVIGETQFNGTGGASSGELLSSAATATPIVPSATSLNIAPNGRGTLTYTLPSGGGTLSLVVYVVSNTKLLLLSTGAAGGSGSSALLSGQALQQTIANGSFAGASLNATTVVRMQRLTPNAAGTVLPDVQVGLLSFTGAGRLSLTSDEDNGGVVSSDTYGGAYTVASNGRVSMTLATGSGGCADCVSPQTYLYLVGANQGFLMDFATSPNVGYFEPQTATGISNATFMGNYSAGTLAPLAGSATLSSAALSSTGAGTLTGTADRDAAGTLSPDVALNLAYSLSGTGRGTVSSGGAGEVLYVISPTKALLLDLTAGSPVIQEVVHQ